MKYTLPLLHLLLLLLFFSPSYSLSSFPSFSLILPLLLFLLSILFSFFVYSL
jgi:hypothetical protein